MAEADLPLEEHLASLLAAYDDGLAANGNGKAAPPAAAVPAELDQRLRENAACLRLLDRLRQRPTIAAASPSEDAVGASQAPPLPPPPEDPTYRYEVIRLH